MYDKLQEILFGKASVVLCWTNADVPRFTRAAPARLVHFSTSAQRLASCLPGTHQKGRGVHHRSAPTIVLGLRFSHVDSSFSVQNATTGLSGLLTLLLFSALLDGTYSSFIVSGNYKSATMADRERRLARQRHSSQMSGVRPARLGSG